MYLRSLDNCLLQIGPYPNFIYDASGGGGEFTIVSNGEDNIKHFQFKNEDFSIPPLSWKNTKILSLPLPPGLKINILSKKLDGSINENTGAIQMEFEAKFIFSICSLFYFPGLSVKTCLKTGSVTSKLHKEDGLSLQENGKVTLVGIAIIPPTGNRILDFFLDLPNEALAVLRCEIK